MKYIRLNTCLLALSFLVFSCTQQKKVSKSKFYNETYLEYLSSVINDTVYFNFAEFTVVDKNIYSILDSVISLSEKCKYFDNKVKYLNAFRFGLKSKTDTSTYTIDAHLSPYQAIGLILVESGVIKNLKNIGIFYYKNYLFVVPSIISGSQNELKYFPFLKKTENILKIRAPRFFNDKVFSSYINFIKVNGGYKIEDNRICDDEILIR